MNQRITIIVAVCIIGIGLGILSFSCLNNSTKLENELNSCGSQLNILKQEQQTDNKRIFALEEEIANSGPIIITDNQDRRYITQLEFAYSYSNENSRIDNTDVYLVITDVTNNRRNRIGIGSYQNEIKQIFHDKATPEGTIMAAEGYCCGYGDNIAIVKQENKLLVYYQELAEGYNIPIKDYQLIKTVPLSSEN